MREKIGDFQICSFDALTTHELYEMMRARADVFVGEEKILYPDADGVDYDCIHVFRTDSDGRVIAYLRMFQKADEPGTVQMGRVLTREHGQGLGHKLLEAAMQGLGHKLLEAAMQGAAQFMGAREVYLESQKHAEDFYVKSGFVAASGEFLEAGIPHIQMRRSLDRRD